MLALAEIFGELLMLKIVYQGVAGAYSHIAAQNIYPGQDYLPCETFEQAMDMVQKNLADVAVIPVENSNAGRVADVHFLLPRTMHNNCSINAS